MTRTHPYDRTFTPPMPALMVDVEDLVTGKRHSNELAIVDSGADRTNIPARVANNIGAQPVGSIDVYDFQGNFQGTKALYRVRIIIDGVPFNVRASETDGELLIGRDLLNMIYLTLNGPKLEFTL